MTGKVCHEIYVERQFPAGEFLEQRQHEAAVGCGDKIVGILDTREDALQIGQHANRVIPEPGGKLFGRNGGEDGHREWF